MALSCKSLQAKYISEMRSRLRAFFIVENYGLETDSQRLWTTFNQSLEKIQKGHHAGWMQHNPNLSYFDCVLLEWCCSTGEMRNHEALKVHKDANKSHPMETMQVFGRIDNTKQQLGKTSQVEQFRSAYLCCLQSMVVLRTRCGRDIWHLNFANTLHVPDATRNTHNWSWVHGP